MRAFSFLKSTQNLNPPSFFLTSTTALFQGLWLGRITPVARMRSTSSLTSASRGAGILLNLSLNGVSSVRSYGMFAKIGMTQLRFVEGEYVVELTQQVSRPLLHVFRP